MKPITEEDLISYQLGEMSPLRRALLRRRLQQDTELAGQAEEIAATLRLFADQPAAMVPEAAGERAWERVRPSLAVLSAPPRAVLSTPKGARGRFWMGVSAGALATALVVAAVGLHFLQVAPVAPQAAAVHPAVAVKQNWGQELLQELHHRRPAVQYNQRPGPLTVMPVDAVAADPQMAMHLDTAERVLTEVSHTEGPLPEETRQQVHRLLVDNAMFHQAAESHGDRSTAAVIDDLGRVLISLDAEPRRSDALPEGLRVQMNLGGVLLDLRILHHNDGNGRTQ